MDILLEELQLVNSPAFHVGLSGNLHATVRRMDIYVDRKVQRRMRAEAAARRPAVAVAGGPDDPPQDPAWLNTDGIDPSGRDFHIHHCSIVNDDDSIAVKPMHRGQVVAGGLTELSCSQDMLIEDMVMTGVGASIGSVPPNAQHNCVRNITFRNVTMPGTTKGIYVKSNPSCSKPGATPATAEITGVLYENFRILRPSWWAVWIGPQQQHEPDSALGEKCALDYPITPHCPTQGCVSFRNITLRDVYIEQPVLAPGVLLGNASQPMEGLVFDNVAVAYTDGAALPPPRAQLRCSDLCACWLCRQAAQTEPGGAAAALEHVPVRGGARLLEGRDAARAELHAAVPRGRVMGRAFS